MQTSRKHSTSISQALFLLMTLLFAASCSDLKTADSNSGNANQTANRNTNNLNSAKDDVAELSILVKLPELPDEVVWREEETANPKGKKLTAVLNYSAENIGKIVALIEKSKTAEQAEIGAEDWFPEELTAQTQLSGNETLKGNVYGAGDFFNPPYEHGRLIRIQETNYLILELRTY